MALRCRVGLDNGHRFLHHGGLWERVGVSPVGEVTQLGVEGELAVGEKKFNFLTCVVIGMPRSLNRVPRTLVVGPPGPGFGALFVIDASVEVCADFLDNGLHDAAQNIELKFGIVLLVAPAGRCEALAIAAVEDIIIRSSRIFSPRERTPAFAFPVARVAPVDPRGRAFVLWTVVDIQHSLHPLALAFSCREVTLCPKVITLILKERSPFMRPFLAPVFHRSRFITD